MLPRPRSRSSTATTADPAGYVGNSTAECLTSPKAGWLSGRPPPVELVETTAASAGTGPDHGWVTVPQSLVDKGFPALRLSVVGGSVGPTMTSTLDPLSLSGADDPASVLGYARAQKQVEDDAAREVLKAAARWAAMHSEDSLVGPIDEWHESCLPLGGQGCPEVAEFAIVEFAAAMGRSTESGRRYLSHAVEGNYRLPRCWARLEAGELPAWRLGVHRRPHPVSVPGGGGVRGRQGRGVRRTRSARRSWVG